MGSEGMPADDDAGDHDSAACDAQKLMMTMMRMERMMIMIMIMPVIT